MIYLDHNATTPLLPEVIEAMTVSLREHWGNPSSTHVYGRRAKQALERARAQVAGLIGCAPEHLVFTSGGTEANNLAIRGVAAASPRRHLVTSAVEHPATALPCRALAELRTTRPRLGGGWTLDVLGVDATGRVDENEAAALVGPDTALVTVMHANNEVGTLQPIAALARIAHAAGALVHTDAAQSVGKVPVDVQALGVDLLSLAGHKLYGPKGVGALYVRPGTLLEPFVRGAGHERGLRPGTENVAAIVGLGVACQAAADGLVAEQARVTALRDRLQERLRAAIPGLAPSGHPTERLPNTLNVRFPDVFGSAVLAAAPSIAASTGSACHEGAPETPSAVLVAMGVSNPLGAVRLSLGRHTTRDEVDAAADALIAAYAARLR